MIAKPKALRILTALLALGMVTTIASDFAIDWHVIASGGAFSTGGDFELTSTIGQPAAGGAMSGGDYELSGGFWAGAPGEPDCNENGVPDWQDILDGTSQDCNADGVPDECESIVADVTAAGSFIGKIFSLDPPEPQGIGNHDPEVMRDGDFPPVGSDDMLRQYDTFHYGDQGDEDWMGYEFSETRVFRSLIFQEGVERPDGGWFDDLHVQVRIDAVWSDVADLETTPPYPGDNDINCETFTFTFAPVAADAIRIYGNPGGSANFISIGELRVIAGQHPTYDCNGNGVLDECDIADGTSQDADGDGIPDECEELLGDLNCDGAVNAFDIDPFVLALTSAPDFEAYYAVYPECNPLLADINGDGEVNGFDIDPFVELLTGG